MNNLEVAKSFLRDCRTISSIFVGLGEGEKLFSLYSNWSDVIWGKDPLGRPIPQSVYRTTHLLNLAIDFEEANEKAKKLCKEFSVSNCLHLTKEPTRQNPYEYRTEEEIRAEKEWTERWEKIRVDVSWASRMAQRWDSRLQHQIKEDFETALSEFSMNESDKWKKICFKKAKAVTMKMKGWRLDAIKEAQKSKFFGNIGEKVELELTHTRFAGYHSQFGYVNIYTFIDKAGNVFIYKGTKVLDYKWNNVKRGDKVTITGFVKEHTKYAPKSFEKCVLKQTRLQRVKVLNLTKCDGSELQDFDKFGNVVRSA